MPTEEFVMRGQTASGQTETLNFGSKDGYAFKLIEFELYPSNAIASNFAEILGTVTAGKTAVDPPNPNFNNDGLIATAMMGVGTDLGTGSVRLSSVVNDTYIITQNLILMVQDTQGDPINWQCRFKPIKMSETEMANANLRQFHVFDE
jgi:hypothetical protein